MTPPHIRFAAFLGEHLDGLQSNRLWDAKKRLGPS